MSDKRHRKACQDCEESTTHQTGSTIWISCKLQPGWRDVNSVCNLSAKEFSKKMELKR